MASCVGQNDLSSLQLCFLNSRACNRLLTQLQRQYDEVDGRVGVGLTKSAELHRLSNAMMII